ncbi:MAG: hypothetical protein JWM57_480 [Phycisphaerales bacterium]|nr:hypothetical protein [Phycisphaerales bacterium]
MVAHLHARFEALREESVTAGDEQKQSISSHMAELTRTMLELMHILPGPLDGVSDHGDPTLLPATRLGDALHG